MLLLNKDAISGTTPVVRSSAGPTLPPELLERSIGRVRILCGVLASVAVIYTIITFLFDRKILGDGTQLPLTQSAHILARFYVIAGASVLLALVIDVLARRTKARPERVILLGLVLQVGGALCITLVETLLPPPPMIRGVSYVCVWILSFNVLPATPRRAALAAFLAATMGPVSLGLNTLVGHSPSPAPATMLLLFLPNYLAATIAVLTAVLVYRLGGDVTRARRMGSYRLVEKLGQGGMGEVWRAEHRTLIRPAAVKLVRRDLAGGTVGDAESLMRRFGREVQTTALLQSPHTVAIYDFGRAHDGTLYYVMELLHGIDLQQLVKRFGPQPSERVVSILRQVCHSLADAHRAGLVHRDIKPANLHLCTLGIELDFIKVLDFGLVKDGRNTFEVGLTMDGKVQGTPAYLAPEAVAGKDVDARADLYSLGCVAYWLLTGRMVFDGTNPMAMLAAHMREAVVPPSQRTELAIPGALETLVMALLAKDRADRPRSALEVLRTLDAIQLPTRWTRDRAERWWQVHLPEVMRRGGCDHEMTTQLAAAA